MIIALTGKMGAGKSTVLEIVKKLAKHGSVGLVKFAQPLYNMQEAIYAIAGLELAPGEKDRVLLQWLGTEWGRKRHGEDFWVHVWENTVAEAFEDGVDVVVTDDCRFDNEAAKIKELEGVIIRVVADEDKRKERMPDANFTNTGHASEAGISDKYVDYTVTNNGSYEELEEQVAKILFKL